MIFAHLVLHSKTQKQLEQFLQNASHALLLSGPGGAGKDILASHLAASILGLNTKALAQYPYQKTVAPDDDKNTISIDAIRELQRFLQLKTTGKSTWRRAVIVRQADKLTAEAQNAFLKILEEPPADTLIIFVSANPRNLLATVRSRLQTIAVQAPDEAAVIKYFTTQGFLGDDITKAYSLSAGLPGLMQALLSQNNDHQLSQGVAVAKTILSGDTFERLSLVDSLAKQRLETKSMLDALSRIAQAGKRQASANSDKSKLVRWHNVQKEVHSAQTALARNVNPKLILTKLMLHV